MKKDYLRPEAEIIDIITSSLMVTSPGGSTEIPGGGDDVQEGDFGTNKHRGDWGNIWGEEE